MHGKGLPVDIKILAKSIVSVESNNVVVNGLVDLLDSVYELSVDLFVALDLVFKPVLGADLV